MKMSNNPAKYEVPVKQYLCLILDVSEKVEKIQYDFWTGMQKKI